MNKGILNLTGEENKEIDEPGKKVSVEESKKIEEMPRRIEEVKENTSSQKLGWKIANVVGFLFVSSLLFSLVMLIITS